MTKGPLDLGCLPELEPLMDVPLVFDWPPVLYATIDPCAIVQSFDPAFTCCLQELDCMMPLCISLEEHESDLSRAPFLAHHERPSLEIRLIELHDFSKNHMVFGEMFPKEIMPAARGLAGKAGEFPRLRDGNACCPCPEYAPEYFIREFHTLEPGMRDERELRPACMAAIATLEYDDLSGPAYRTKNILSEHDAADEFRDSSLRRYLVDMVHAFHDSEGVPSALHYPIECPLTILDGSYTIYNQSVNLLSLNQLNFHDAKISFSNKSI